MTTKRDNRQRIGLFDSGVGGLSILRRLAQRCATQKESNYRFIYLADSARCPYGDKSPEEISTYAKQITKWLAALEVERIVIACNTSAAVAAELARQCVNIPVHDLINPASRYAAKNFKRVGVIATSVTCKTQAFSKAINSFNPEVEVTEIACPDLVPLVESGTLNGPEVIAIVSKYTDRLKEANVDSLIFGCTHFPFLAHVFRLLLGEQVFFIDPAVYLNLEIFGETKDNNCNPETLNCLYKESNYFTTGNAELFNRAAERCLELAPGVLD